MSSPWPILGELSVTFIWAPSELAVSSNSSLGYHYMTDNFLTFNPEKTSKGLKSNSVFFLFFFFIIIYNWFVLFAGKKYKRYLSFTQLRVTVVLKWFYFLLGQFKYKIFMQAAGALCCDVQTNWFSLSLCPSTGAQWITLDFFMKIYRIPFYAQ